MKTLHLCIGALLALSVAGCDIQSLLVPPDDEAPVVDALAQVSEDPVFVRFSSDVELADTAASFWAVKGENREVTLRYVDDEHEDEPGDQFLRFRVPDESLYRRPDGSLMQEGDSIQISVSVDSDGRFIFDFQPTGLVFNPDKPAELKIWYDGADLDLNGDGVIDDDDVVVEQTLRIFRRDSATAGWEDIGFLEFDSTEDEIKGKIEHFTGFALAS